MKIQKNKFKYILLSTILVATTAVIPTVLLTSCSSSNSTYGPYTVLNINNSNYNNKFVYWTGSNSIEFYNSNNSIINDASYNNTWVNLSTLRSYYLKLSKQNIQTYLNDDNNIDEIINNHKQPNDTVVYDKTNIKNAANSLSFLYGVNASSEQTKIANLYNYMNILNSVFSYSTNFATTLLNYLITSEFPVTYNNLISQSPQQYFSIFNCAEQIKNNNYAKQFLLGNGISFGIGANTYHLWPSGFSADITSINTNLNINSPYPYFQTTNEFNGQKEIVANNIKINFQWYKTKNNGGEYVPVSNINEHLTDEQRSILEKVGIKNNDVVELTENGFEININTPITFNLFPESYSYTDPLYSNLSDYVYTGIYNVVPKAIKGDVSNDIVNTITYPSSILDKNSTHWRLLKYEQANNRYNETSLGKDLYDNISSEIRNNNMGAFNNDATKKIPYLVNNNSWASSEKNSSYSFQSINIDYTDAYYINSIFLDPYYDSNSNRYVANNQNDLPKENYINLWFLGSLVNDELAENIELNYNKLKKISSNTFKSSDSVAKNLSEYKSTFDVGLSTYYKLVNIGSVTKGTMWEIINNEITNS